MFTRIDHVALVVKDADASRDFYCQCLGFTVERELVTPSLHRKICFLRLGDTLLELLQQTSNRTGDASGITGCHISLATTDFEAAVRGLVQAEVRVLRLPVAAGGGLCRASFAGPDGEEIEIVG